MLGELAVITPAKSFPLSLIRPKRVAIERVVLVGDAAHTMHPLAGQGVNLGFQDVNRLATLLADEHDSGDWMLLRRYERQRRESVRTMQLACDGLFQLFKARLPGLPLLRNAALNLTNCLTPLKRKLARQAVSK